jgi:hypothetical protein
MIVTIHRSVGIGFERYLYGFSIVTAHGIIEHEHSFIGVSGRLNPPSLFFHEITYNLGNLPSGSIRHRPRIPITKRSSTLTKKVQFLPIGVPESELVEQTASKETEQTSNAVVKQTLFRLRGLCDCETQHCDHIVWTGRYTSE